MSLFSELRRRNVLRMAAAYVVTAWLVVQVVETIFPAFGFGDAAIRIVVICVAIGFLPAMVLAWIFEFTPEGLKKDTEVDRSLSASLKARKNVDRAIMLVLAVGLSFFAFDKFVLDPVRVASQLEEARQEGRTEAILDSFADRSIAVMPFVNMSSDPEQTLFSEGISEELLNLLARIPELRVISRSSSFQFRGNAHDIIDIGKQLDVVHVLEGSVRRSGNQLRITAQLIDARTNTYLWSGSYDRSMGDVFAIQDEIAADVVERLKVALVNPIPKVRRTNVEAFSKTLQARQLRHLGRSEEANILLQDALQLDSKYVPAWTELSMVRVRLAGMPGFYSEEEGLRLSGEAMQTALALDPNDSLANALYAWDLVEWDHHLERAAALAVKAASNDPGNAEVLFNVGKVARWLGHHAVAARVYERAITLDPLCFNCEYHLSKIYMEVGRYEEAIKARRDWMQNTPGMGGNFELGLMYLLHGDPAAALQTFENIGAEQGRQLVGLVMANYDLGRMAESEAALAELVGKFAADNAAGIARAYAWTGQSDLAFEWLEKAYGPDLQAFHHTLHSPVWRRLTNDPRWQELRQRAGFSKERLAAIEFQVAIPR